MGYCKFSEAVDTPKKCFECYDNWPIKAKGKYSRAYCKQRNWVGQVDVNHHNEFCETEKVGPIK